MKIHKITEASDYLGVSINTLKTLANNGKIKSFKTTGEHRRFRQEDLDAYMGVEKEKQMEFEKEEEMSEQADRIEAKLDRILALLEPKPKRGVKQAVEKHTWVELWLDSIWNEYPKQAGSNPRKSACKALHAHTVQGCDLEAIRAGALRYRAFCDATGKTGTEYVMQASRFFGPGREWENLWELPAPEAKQPKTDEDWLELAAVKGVATRPGESWAELKQRIQGARTWVSLLCCKLTHQ